MKTYVYNELGDEKPIEINEDQIMDQYWEYWWSQIIKVGHMKNSNAYYMLRYKLRQECIDDFVAVNWAVEKK